MAHYVKKRVFPKPERQRNEWFRAVELDLAKFWPVHTRLTASFRSAAKKAIFVAAIAVPAFTWVNKVVDTDVAQKRPVHQRLTASFIAPAKRAIDVRQIAQPRDTWRNRVVDGEIAQQRPVHEQLADGFVVRAKRFIDVRQVAQPSDAWVFSSLTQAFDPAPFTGVYLQELAGFRSAPRAAINVCSINEPGFDWLNAVAVSTINPGDEVQVLISGGIECTVHHDTGTEVRVVVSSAKQITVLHTGGTPIKVTI